MTNSLQLYLTDVLPELLEQARAASADYAAARVQRDESEFKAGRALAFYECFSLLVMQLDAFGIARESVGLSSDLDVERELL